MQTYASGRKSANNVQILGWILIAFGLLAALASVGASMFGASHRGLGVLGLPLLLPSAVFIMLGSFAILGAHVARAVFDIADRGGT